MTFTYDPDVASNRDKVRLLIGDTDAADAIFSDSEVAFFLSENGDSVGRAAVHAASCAAAKYTRLCDTAVESLRVSYSQKATQFMGLYGQLLSRLESGSDASLLVGATGIRQSEIDAAEDDEDRAESAFKTKWG